MFSRPALIVVAHPDDEVLGLGTLLPQLRKLHAIIHVTDGAPRRGADAAKAGVGSPQEYAALRRHELAAALRAASVHHVRLICLRYPDQESAFHLQQLTKRLVALINRFRPGAIFTHPYEGGHPDHDSCAFAVRSAWSSLAGSISQPEIVEFASYHRGQNGGFESERFLNPTPRTWPQPLTQQQREWKSDVLSKYASQSRVLAQFPLRAEPIRIAPEYEFSKPPHGGKLYYENYDWGLTGANWRRLARRATAVLGRATSR